MSVNASSLPTPPSGNGSTTRMVFNRIGRLDACRIEEYIGNDGYSALRRTVGELGPEGTIDLLAKAGLRGRGGAGFDTAQKWRLASKRPASERYVVANAFGADPTAFGDRTLLESDPHAVLEGLAIAAFAIGAKRAFVYCCLDHVEVIQRVNRAIMEARERGFLGASALGGKFDCQVSVIAAPGGFAAGEETAAIALIEGKRPMPSEKPPFPAEAGLWGQPTVINNAETLANVPWIIRNGPERFAETGSAGNNGTKLVTVAGRLTHSGLFEVPLGITMRQVIAEYAGGMRAGTGIKAVQFGGPCGGCLPESMLDTKLEFDALKEAGTIMGSGTLLVLDESACMVDFARSQLELLATESCGRCVPGRLGTQRLLMILEQIASGEGRPGDLELLTELCENMAAGAVCAYGILAANPVLSTLRHFRAEFEAHLSEKQCPAGRCEITAAKTPERREELWKRTWPIRR